MTEQDAKPSGSIAATAEPAPNAGAIVVQEQPSYWPTDWRETVAARAGGDDQRAVAKELKRLQRFADPAAIYGSERALESKFSDENYVRVPGNKSSAEDQAAFRKALGVPERPEDYFNLIELPDGAVIGEADRPLADSFAAAVHAADATPGVVSAALGWYYRNQDDQAAALDAADQSFRRESETMLKRAWGPRYRATVNAIGTLFAGLPGGTESEGGGVFARLMGGRTADGRQIGDDPEIMKALAAWAQEINPNATIANSAGDAGRSIETEIGEIEARMRSDRAGYFRDAAAQSRYRELLAARDSRR